MRSHHTTERHISIPNNAFQKVNLTISVRQHAMQHEKTKCFNRVKGMQCNRRAADTSNRNASRFKINSKPMMNEMNSATNENQTIEMVTIQP